MNQVSIKQCFLFIIGILGFLGTSKSVIAQNYHEITVKIANYNNDTLLLGYYFGKAQYVKDTVIKKDGLFVFEGKDTLSSGMYMILTQPDHQFVQIIVDEDDQKFKVEFDIVDLQKSLKITNSLTNDHFMDYVGFLNALRPEAELLRQRMASDTISEPNKKKLQAVLDGFDGRVEQYQNDLITKFPKDFTGAMISSQKDVDIPEFEAQGDSLKRMQFAYYYKHYFDYINLNDARLLYAPFMYQKVSNYVEKLTPQIPDSINNAIDVVLGNMDKDGEPFKYFMAYFINRYARSEFIGMDAVFVHMVDNYYGKGMAPWVEKEALNKMIKNAKTLKPILIGKQAPPITVFDSTGKAIVLYDIKAKYTILAFWAPDCGHCKKSMPQMVDLYEDYKDKGVRVLAICTKLMKKEKTCWPMVREKGLDVLMNGTDKYLESRFKQLYDVTKTPKVYLLDENKKIISKNIGPEQLEKLLDRFIADDAK